VDVLERLGASNQMPILIKPFLYLIAFGPLAILFATVFGLACWLLMVCVQGFTWLQVSARSTGPPPLHQPTPVGEPTGR